MRELERRLAELHERAGTRDRDLDLLRFEIDEIEAVDPSEADREELAARRERLRGLDALAAAAGGGAETMAPESGEAGVAGLLAEAESVVGAVPGVDPELDALAARVASLRIEADDLGGELRRYLEGLEGDPGQLEEVEGRLELYDRLERKHGGNVAAVLAHAEHCRERRDALERAEVELEESQVKLEAAARRVLAPGRRAHRGPARCRPAAGRAGPRRAPEPGHGGRRVPGRAGAADRRSPPPGPSAWS